MLKVFVASSRELGSEREELATIANSVNGWLAELGEAERVELGAGEEERVGLEKWEYLNSAMGVEPKQNEYDRKLRDCDAVVGLCWRCLGKYTVRELSLAREEIRAGHRVRRLEVWFKDVAEDDAITPELASFRNRFGREWGVQEKSFASMEELRGLFTKMVLELLQKAGIPLPNAAERKKHGLAADAKGGGFGGTCGANTHETKRGLRRTRTVKTVRVRVEAGKEKEILAARRAVDDVLMLLNHHERGVEFVGGAGGEEDWLIALYWKEFGEMGREEFNKVYEKFKREKTPVIHVFFKEPDEGIGAALKSFKKSLEEENKYFYCPFENVDAVRFQIVSQGLWLLPHERPREERGALEMKDGVVWLGNDTVARMENLPFAKLNDKRKSLVERIAAAERRVRDMEKRVAMQGNAKSREELRAASVEYNRLKEELKEHDGVLFDAAVSIAKMDAEETSERTRKAWALFWHGKVQEANRLLDLDAMTETARRIGMAFRAQRAAYEMTLQEHLAKAPIVMADDSMPIPVRVDVASRVYDAAIVMAREIHWEEGKLAATLFDYAQLLDKQKRFHPSVQRYGEALAIWRRLAATNPETYAPSVALALNNLANLHSDMRQLATAEAEYGKALKIYRRLAKANPNVYEPGVARVLNNIAILLKKKQDLAAAERRYKTALGIYRRFAAVKPEVYETDVAKTLNNLAILHKKMHRPEKAEAEFGKALEIRRRLAAGKKEADEVALSATLNSLAILHKDTHRFGEAEDEYREALEIRRRLALLNPDAYEPDMATTLNNLANLHCKMNRLTDAESEYGEALEIRRRFMAVDLIVYEGDVAMTLHNLALLHRDTRQTAKAEAEFEEAVLIWRRLVADRVMAHETDLAETLGEWAILKRAEGDGEGARKLAVESLTIFGRWEERMPGVYAGEMRWAMEIAGENNRDSPREPPR